MDGMLGQHPFLSTPDGPAPLLGILYAEDFDDLPAEPLAPEPTPDLAPAERSISELDVEQACIAAVQRARLEWEREAEQGRRSVLAAIADAVASARQEAAREATALAEGTVTTMLSMLAGALPTLCRDHGPSEARALVEHLLPSLRSEPRVTIRVHPSLVPVLEEDLRSSEHELTGAISVTGASLEPGDLRVTWENGSFKRDTRATLTAMQDALAQLGLQSPIEITPERRMELAE